MDMMNVVRILAASGLSLLFLAGCLYGLTRLNIPLWNLPGDLVIKGKQVSCAVPIITSILLSIFLTLILNILLRFLQR